jgi:pimeloyl-ACP methyl ester carboxylesterase
MDHVGWPTAHVVGHSYGALVALQVALELPGRASSVALLEPAARGVSSSAAVVSALQPIIEAYGAGDTAGAVDGFLRHVCGDGYRDVLERQLPGAFDEALGEADLFFQAEMPAVARWAFGPAQAAGVRQPVLNVLGTESEPRFVEGSELVQCWFPAAERLSVPRACHLLMVQNPQAVAEGLTAFFARHPIDAASSH